MLPCGPEAVNKLAKSQAVRVLDVLVIGPLMVFAATRLPKQNRLAAYALGFFGVTTVLYNARNWLRVAQAGSSSTT